MGEHIGVGVAGEAARVIDLDAAEDEPAPLGETMTVIANPDAHPSILPHAAWQRLEPALATFEDADLPDPKTAEELKGLVVAEANLLGQVGVGGEREGGTGLDAHLGKAHRRVDLTDGLAQACRGDLDRDPALGDRFNGRLVEEARIALGQRSGAAPDLDQVGMGEDVKEAGTGALGQGGEVAAPDLIRIAATLPDVPAGVIDGGVTDEVNRAEDVVEVARLDQRRGAILGGGDVVALDPEPQRRAADELAIRIEVVASLFLPEGMAPKIECLGEAVDVLGDAQLRDPGRLSGSQIAVDVLAGKEALAGGVGLVGTEMKVVVGKHGTGRVGDPGHGYAGAMVHLRIVVPTDRCGKVLDLLETAPSTTNLVFLAGAARQPKGDVVLCDIAREDASVLIEDLKELGVARDGSISLEQIDSQLSEAADRAERAAYGKPSNAVVWEEVEARTSESTELGGNFLIFMVLACLIASVGIFLGSPILIVGAMVVGPEFGPLAGFCVAVVERRRDVAARSLTALAIGFPVGITAAFIFTLISKWTGMLASDFSGSMHPLTQFISKPDDFSFIVACFAGAAGVLSLTSAKSGALIGVLISVTTIPAAANIGVAFALGDWSEWRGAMAQLVVNLTAIVLAGVVTLSIQRRLFERRRQRHMDDDSRAIAGLPNKPGRALHR